MGIIAEKTIGVSYEQSVYHIGVAFANEDKRIRPYGYSFRIEYSHRSGVVHTKLTASGQGGFRDWLENQPDLLTTAIDFRRFNRKQRVINAALQKIESAYCKYLLEAKP